mgnify:CR=1 FL=1
MRIQENPIESNNNWKESERKRNNRNIYKRIQSNLNNNNSNLKNPGQFRIIRENKEKNPKRIRKNMRELD